MNPGLKYAIGGGLVVAALAGLGALSRVPYVAEPLNDAVVRLAWRTRGTRVEACRHRTPEEMAKLPLHMREGEVCERRLLPYLLTVAVGEASPDSTMVRAAGVREDRPLFVYRELPVAPGRHRIRVEFIRQGEPGKEAPHAEELEPEHGEYGETPQTAARLTLDTIIAVGEREIALVTYDPDSRRLVVRVKAGS
jgi:hypothetical protein